MKFKNVRYQPHIFEFLQKNCNGPNIELKLTDGLKRSTQK